MDDTILLRDNWKENEIIKGHTERLNTGLEAIIGRTERDIEDLKRSLGNPEFDDKIIQRDIRFQTNKLVSTKNELASARKIDYDTVLTEIQKHPEVELLQLTRDSIYILTKPLKFEPVMEWTQYKHGGLDDMFKRILAKDPYVGQFIIQIRHTRGSSFPRYYITNTMKRCSSGEEDWDDDVSSYPYSHWGINLYEMCEGDWTPVFKQHLRTGNYHAFLVAVLDYLKSAGAMGAYMNASSFLSDAEDLSDPIERNDVESLDKLWARYT